MGFSSSVTDYEGDRLTFDKICGVDMYGRLIETNFGWALISSHCVFDNCVGI